MSPATATSGNQPARSLLMDEPIVFFGSGPVAAESLARLHEHFNIEAVVTKPQPAHHKEPFPVLSLAEKLGLKVLTPNGKQELSALFATRPLRSRLGVVIDYGFIINQDVIDYFELGIVNSHFSLLPEWRGADPITFAILSGQKQTGVSLMLIVAKMDEGPLLAQAPFDITDDMTTPELTEALIDVSDRCLQQILPLYAIGQALPAAQDSVTMAQSEPTYSRKLTKADGIIDWNKPAVQLEREVRAFLEWPKTRTDLNGIDVIITQAHAVASQQVNAEPGTIEQSVDCIMIATGNGSLCIDRLKPAGKADMDAKAFLNGYKLF